LEPAASITSAGNLPKTSYMVDSTGKLLFKPGDLGFNLQAGTVFGSNFKGSSSFGTYISPALAYNVSSRFRIKTGVTVFNNFGDSYNAGHDSYFNPVFGRGATTSLFVQGDYLLSNKVMISGAVYKDIHSFNQNINDPRLKMPESQGMILNFNYRPTRNFEFNASFEYGNGNRSMLHSPFYPGSFVPGNSPW